MAADESEPDRFQLFGGSCLRGFELQLAATASVFMLAGCGGGGGGGGVASTPTPVPAPAPAPTNTSIGLVASQSFATDASGSNVTFDLASKTTSNAAAGAQTITIAYDAAAKSYTLTSSGRSTTFLPGDAQASTGEAASSRYVRTSASGSESLTLSTTPFTGTAGNQYVALGYSQRNDVSGNAQRTGFDTFTYGLETAIASVPRNGSASWRTDLFGLYTAPGRTPRTIQGSGDFTVDFGQGLFTTTTSVVQFDFVTGASLSGGGVEVTARGALGSNNSFSGNLAYGGTDGAVAGTISGRFYGPGAEEIGAAFSADNATGGTLNGALTGQRTATKPTNFTLGSISTDQLSSSVWAILDRRVTPSGSSILTQTPLYGQTTQHPDGSITIGPPDSGLPNVTLTSADRLPISRANFTSYQKIVEGNPVQVDLYRPDNGSQAIALTYAGFGIWRRSAPVAGLPLTRTTDGYFTYGFPTPAQILARRTGAASYDGTSYGTASAVAGTRYDVGGTSHFDVDFTNQRFSGSLTLSATPEGGGAAAALGSWQFGREMAAGLVGETTLINAASSSSLNTIVPSLYGADGQEIAAPFTIAVGAAVNGTSVSVAGVTLAKRR
jgi:hypothetical protein